jgi:prepilin-type processing-associated H-X9-DG protein
VVIAIIAILAALLLPALAAAKSKALNARCQSNTKQMTLALMMYPSESDGFLIPDMNQQTVWNFPGPPLGQGSPDTGAWIVNLIAFYGKATNLFICPVCTDPNPYPGSGGGGKTVAGSTTMPWASMEPRNDTVVNGVTITAQWYYGCYGYNGWCFSDKFGDGSGSPNNYFVKETAIKRPNMTPIFYDQTWTDAWPVEGSQFSQNLKGLGGTTTLPSGGNQSMARIAKARHGSGGGAKAPSNYTGTLDDMPKNMSINMGFADGHVESVKLGNLWDFYWHATWNPKLVKPPITAGANGASN